MALKQTLLMWCIHLKLEQLFEDTAKFFDKVIGKLLNKYMLHLQTLGVTTNE